MNTIQPAPEVNFDGSVSSEQATPHISIYRFDLFKGTLNPAGKIERIRSVGSASLRDGFNTYLVELKTLLEDRFFLLPSKNPETGPEFVILTRETARNSTRKYFWNVVGEAKTMSTPNHGLLKLSWDLFSDDIYMSIHPKKSYEVPAVRLVGNA